MKNAHSVTNSQYTPFDQIEKAYYISLDDINSRTTLVNDNIGVCSINANNKKQEPHPQCDTTTTTTTNSPSVPDCISTTTGETYIAIVRKDGEKISVHVQPPPLSTYPQCDTTTTTSYLPDCTTTTTSETYNTIVRKDGEKVTIHVQPPPLSKESTSDEMTPTFTEEDTIQQEPIYDQPLKKQPPQKPQRPDIF